MEYEHLDTKTIIAVLDRMAGDIHAYGETHHDKQTYENLKAYGKVFGHMLQRIGEETGNCNSGMGSVQANGERALKILKNAYVEINDLLEDYDKVNQKVYVSIYYSFDRESPLYEFDSDEEAQSFIEKQYEQEIKTTKQDDCAHVKKSVCKKGFAQIVFDNDDRDIIEWNICQQKDY